MKREPRKAHGVRFSDQEWEAITKSADEAGQTASEWIRTILRRKTRLTK